MGPNLAGTSVLLRRGEEDTDLQCEGTEGRWLSSGKERGLSRNQHASTLILDFWLLDLGEN